MTDKSAELAKAHDMLQIMEQERNSLANRLVHMQADGMALQRKVQELEAKLAASPMLDLQDSARVANGEAREAAH